MRQMKEGGHRHGIFLAHRSALIDYATPILGSREAAEDIVQDAFLRFVPAKARFSSSDQSLAYLYRIVRNLAFDVLKRRKLEIHEAESNAPFWMKPQAEPTPEHAVLYRDQIRVVSQALSELPVQMRIAVEMHRFGGFTLEEIARHLDISVPTAHRHVRKALLMVAARLDGGED